MNSEKNLEIPTQKITIVNKKSQIPLFGLDYLGVLDRGTNILEIKPITICNLHCKYCFVSAGDYNKNFIADSDYLIHWIVKAIKIKDCDDIEVHLAPYGEIFLFKDVFNLISRLKKIPEIKTISMQTNGLLLTQDKIKKLERAGLDRINISLNSMDPKKCATYCGVKKYDLNHLLQIFDYVLKSTMDLLIAPVWFKNVNDKGIKDIIAYIKKKENEGYIWPKLRLGIQNYLTYKTGRKIKKTRMREFGYFYKILHEFENKFNIKLKLGPNDFGIHKTKAVFPPVRLNDVDNVQIIMKGRWDNEYIARLNPNWAVKVLSNVPLKKYQKIRVKFIKSSLRGNLLTGIPF